MRLSWGPSCLSKNREILATPCRWELNLVLQALLEVFSSSLCSSLHSSKSCPQGLAVTLDTKSTGVFLMLLCGWCWPCSPAAQPQVELGRTILYDLLVLWGKTRCVCAHLHTWRAWHLRTVGSCGSKASCIWWASIKGSYLGQNPSLKEVLQGAKAWVQWVPFLKLWNWAQKGPMKFLCSHSKLIMESRNHTFFLNWNSCCMIKNFVPFTL